MYRLNVLYGTPTDPTHFQEYYLSTHLPLAAKLPELRAFRYAFEVGALGAGESPYYAIFEADFDSADAMATALGSPEGQAAAADIDNYATGGATLVHYSVNAP